MSNKKYQFKCGTYDDGSEDEYWKNEVVCTLCGCKSCKNYNGTEYYEQNTRRALGLWAKHELSVMDEQ